VLQVVISENNIIIMKNV